MWIVFHYLIRNDITFLSLNDKKAFVRSQETNHFMKQHFLNLIHIPNNHLKKKATNAVNLSRKYSAT